MSISQKLCMMPVAQRKVVVGMVAIIIMATGIITISNLVKRAKL